MLPCIASELGVSDEIATLTRATMDGHIDFEPSFRLRCLILGQVPVETVCSIVKTIPLDEDVLSFIRDNRRDSYLATGNLDLWIKPLVEICGCEAFSSKASIEQGRLRLNSILDKGAAVQELRRRGYDRIVAVGDGANDVSMLTGADVGIAFGGVHAPASATILVSDYIIHDGATLCRTLQGL